MKEHIEFEFLIQAPHGSVTRDVHVHVYLQLHFCTSSEVADPCTTFFQLFVSLAVVVQCGNVIPVQSAYHRPSVYWAYLRFFCRLISLQNICVIVYRYFEP